MCDPWNRKEHTEEEPGRDLDAECFKFKCEVYIIILFLLKFSYYTLLAGATLYIKFLRNLRHSRLGKYLYLDHNMERITECITWRPTAKISNLLYFYCHVIL